MSTPNMSGRTDAPAERQTREASDFLTDGSVDLSKIKEVTNATAHGADPISVNDCAAIRKRVLDTDHSGEVATALGYGDTTVRRHARGECHHAERLVDHPPVTHTRGEGWAVDREEGDA